MGNPGDEIWPGGKNLPLEFTNLRPTGRAGDLVCVFFSCIFFFSLPKSPNTRSVSGRYALQRRVGFPLVEFAPVPTRND